MQVSLGVMLLNIVEDMPKFSVSSMPGKRGSFSGVPVLGMCPGIRYAVHTHEYCRHILRNIGRYSRRGHVHIADIPANGQNGVEGQSMRRAHQCECPLI